jgi:hypothetical protein
MIVAGTIELNPAINKVINKEIFKRPEPREESGSCIPVFRYSDKRGGKTAEMPSLKKLVIVSGFGCCYCWRIF